MMGVKVTLPERRCKKRVQFLQCQPLRQVALQLQTVQLRAKVSSKHSMLPPPHPKVWYQRSSTNFQLPADVYIPFPPSARSDRNLHFNLQGGILPWFLCSSLAPSQVDHVPAILARKRSWFVLRARWLRGNRALKAFCVAYLPASEALESFNWPQTRRSQGQWHFTGESFFQEKGEPRVMVFKP